MKLLKNKVKEKNQMGSLFLKVSTIWGSVQTQYRVVF